MIKDSFRLFVIAVVIACGISAVAQHAESGGRSAAVREAVSMYRAVLMPIDKVTDATGTWRTSSVQ